MIDHIFGSFPLLPQAEVARLPRPAVWSVAPDRRPRSGRRSGVERDPAPPHAPCSRPSWLRVPRYGSSFLSSQQAAANATGIGTDTEHRHRPSTSTPRAQPTPSIDITLHCRCRAAAGTRPSSQKPSSIRGKPAAAILSRVLPEWMRQSGVVARRRASGERNRKRRGNACRRSRSEDCELAG